MTMNLAVGSNDVLKLLLFNLGNIENGEFDMGNCSP